MLEPVVGSDTVAGAGDVGALDAGELAARVATTVVPTAGASVAVTGSVTARVVTPVVTIGVIPGGVVTVVIATGAITLVLAVETVTEGTGGEIVATGVDTVGGADAPAGTSATK